ncbi:MAG: hypothetical protein K0R65_1777 [Crocinitomicaceae bacterium]|jgi:hypothetical protein|nr:hypothetical protein [Crocinitomicaceae bacterium]
MKNLLFPALIVLLAACGPGAATQENDKDEIYSGTQESDAKTDETGSSKGGSAVQKITDFIPKGYSLLDSASGSLNFDKYPDMLLVLKKNDEEKTSDVIDNPEKRPLLILTGNADKSYSLASRNDNSVLCVNCGGMMGEPYQSLTIKDGYFSVEHYGGSAWRWTRIITYKYDKWENDWFLHKDGTESYHTSDPDKVETTLRTSKDFGKIPFGQFDIYKEQ